MPTADLKTKLSTLDADKLLKWLALIVAIASAVIVTVFASYFLTFDGALTAKQDYWGQFGDFIGGTLNPIFSFLTLMAIVLTVVLQHKQLEMSRVELEATREELRCSAAAREKSELTLSKQATAMEISARISAVNNLLTQAEASISRITSWAPGSNEEAIRNNAIKSRAQLLVDLKQLYERLKETDAES